MKVSVIIPCFNYGHFLAETLHSVAMQTMHNWECIIIDDGSTDNTRLVAEQFIQKDQRFIYLFQENKGLSNARNKGLSISKGEYIQFLDSDDLIEKDKLIRQCEYLDMNPESDIIYSDARYFYTESPGSLRYSLHHDDHDWMPRLSGKGQKIINAILKRNIFPVNAPLFRKSIVSDNIQFKESLKYNEDWDFWLSLAFKNYSFNYKNTPVSMALIRIHGESMSLQKTEMDLFKFPVFLNVFVKEKLSFRQLCYIWLRSTELFYNSNFVTNRLKIRNIILPSELPSLYKYLIPAVLLLSFPLYILIILYRLTFKFIGKR